MESDILIAFDFKPSIGFLGIENMEIYWLNNIDKNDEFFKRLNNRFDYYFFNNILIYTQPYTKLE